MQLVFRKYFMPIGKRLREERERLGLSQPAFAALAGTTKQTLFSWETGKTAPDGFQLAALATSGADVLYILTGMPTPVIPTPEPGELLLVANYRKCTPEDQAELIRESTLYAEHVKTSTKNSPAKIAKATVKKSLFGGAIGSIRIGK
ncbi:helix-turn-helix domain-containing protein [Acidovorax sp. ACV01]|uniref:helix-turn-helix domain-containing protein n=1 Tax=Acidovorax sp. ACV01 TaxID=2769311 RepID=UPI001CE0AA67|nr:helix-turn-helix domain-containing protein [Acidovorax sp. ACV01]